MINTDLIILFVGEIVIILTLYHFLIKEMIVNHWERKVKSDNGEWLVEMLEPVIEEVEVRTNEAIETYTAKFFGSIGKMTADAKKLDPMNDIRKAAKNNDWTSLIVEYMANKSGLGAFLPQNEQQPTQVRVPEVPKPRQFKP